jgi:predicted enzyme related to lactoylglutathione lyase
MTESHGRFVWYELSTTDQKAAKKFYADVVGWGTEEAQMPGMTYTMFKQGDLQAAGMTDLQEQAKKMGRAAELDGLCRCR